MSTKAIFKMTASPRRKIILHVMLLACLYLAIRIPLAEKPLGHDEIYNTFLYLETSPLTEGRGAGWGTDWKRQIAVHPPFLPTFYYFWIRAFGDSEMSLHIPTIVAGLAGIILLYFFGSLIFDSDVAFLAALATALSIAHITYSTEAGHAIFESLILLASLLCFSKFIMTGEKRLFGILLVLNAIGAFIFYHYFIYLLLQTAVLWFYRKRLKITRYYFMGVSVLVLLFLGLLAGSFSARRYSYDFWIRGDFITLAKVLGSLPYRGIGVEAIPARYAHITPFRYFFVLFSLPFLLLFLIGCGRILLSFKRRLEAHNIPGLILVPLVFAPFVFYFAMSASGRKFGEPRNFFYLLPIYFLIIFNALNALIRNRKMFYAASSVILIFFLSSGVFHSVFYWKPVYAEREMIESAAVRRSESLPAPLTRTSRWPLQYYAKKYDIPDGVYKKWKK